MFDSYWSNKKLYIGDDDNQIFITCNLLKGIDIAVENKIDFKFDLEGVDTNELLSDIDDYLPISDDYLTQTINRWNYIGKTICKYEPFNDKTINSLITNILVNMYELKINGYFEADGFTKDDVDGYLLYELEKNFMNNTSNKSSYYFGKMIHNMEMFEIIEIFNYR